MSRYGRSPDRAPVTINNSNKPLLLGQCSLQNSDQTYIQSLIVKASSGVQISTGSGSSPSKARNTSPSYKQMTEVSEDVRMQKAISEDLCRKFQKSVGVSVMEMSRQEFQKQPKPAQTTGPSSKKLGLRVQPTALIAFKKWIIRIWVKQDDIVFEEDHFNKGEEVYKIGSGGSGGGGFLQNKE